jgi:hypothetical protein
MIFEFLELNTSKTVTSASENLRNMRTKIYRCSLAQLLCSVLICFAVICGHCVSAQTAEVGTLKGKITSSSGSPIANAKVTIISVEASQTRATTTDENGNYEFENLTSGDYRFQVAAASFQALEIASAAVTAGTTVLNETMQTAPAAGQSAPAENLPNAPSSTEPSLSDLGITPQQTQGNAKEQALLDKRTRMLKTHQRMGLITAVPLVATVVTSLGAGGRDTSKTSRDLHAALGGLTGDLYFITAYYAIRAPRIKGTETRGPIKFHKAMAWIHGPGMIATPILGIIAFDQKNKGEKVHGIAQAHGPVAIVTAGAFGAALLSVSVKF